MTNLIASRYITRSGLEIVITKRIGNSFLCETVESKSRHFMIDAITLDCAADHNLDLIEKIPDQSGGPLIKQKKETTK